MTEFHEVRVSEVRRETPESVSLCLEPVNGEAQGRFVFLPGQYVTLRADIAGEEVRRSYSICSAPEDGELRVGIKEVAGGKFSSFANQQLKAGDVLEAMAPMGRFVLPETIAAGDHFVAFAAGSGITPVLSQIKHLLAQHPGVEVSLFYVNKTASSVMFRDELAALKDEHLDRFRMFHLLTREPVEAELFSGRLDADRCRRIIAAGLIDLKSVTGAYLCGPEQMILDCKAVLVESGLAESRVHFELFHTSKQEKMGEVKTETASTSGAIPVQIVLDGITTTVEISGNKTFMDAALDAGLDAPYSCLGGVCCTCRAKMVSGKARMDVNYALEPDEVEKGFVLTCQSHPEGEGPFVVDFDQQ